MIRNRHFPSQALIIIGISFTLLSAWQLKAKDYVIELDGKKLTLSDLAQKNPQKFYEIEKERYDLISQMAQDLYLENYWKSLSKDKSLTAVEARDAYIKNNIKISNKELQESLKKFQDHERLKNLPQAEREKMVTSYLRGLKTQQLVNGVLKSAFEQGKIKLAMTEPEQPRFPIKIGSDEAVKYSSNPQSKAIECKAEDCAITVVEYSEFQCPYCSRVSQVSNKLLDEYKGKIRWVVRDFPLDFHKRAKPAAVAAHCANDQGKYWEMYDILFANQKRLSDADFKDYAKTIGLNTKTFEKCVSKPEEKIAIIDRNQQEALAKGVSGTPAFFVNGRRFSGVKSYEEFKSIFQKELSQ